MKKIKPIKLEKVWGYELWLYSPLKSNATIVEETGKPVDKGPLIKIISTTQPLSVQVHPDDHYAMELENQPNGKSESWFVLDKAHDDAELILGLKSYDKPTLKEAIENNNFESFLNHVRVNVGDFYDIPAGLIHGIGANLTIFEVQQPSDVTYRYYDYGRLENGKPRELHIEKALTVQKELSWELQSREYFAFKEYKNIVGSQIYGNGTFTAPREIIVVDLITYDTWLLDANEKITLDKFVAVSI